MTLANEFKNACIDMNSVTELREALAKKSADKIDTESWGITAREWRWAIERALEYKLEQMAVDSVPVNVYLD